MVSIFAREYCAVRMREKRVGYLPDLVSYANETVGVGAHLCVYVRACAWLTGVLPWSATRGK